jgi:regulator of protease activity HflC (stomatin/prohibitin superfamily)
MSDPRPEIPPIPAREIPAALGLEDEIPVAEAPAPGTPEAAGPAAEIPDPPPPRSWLWRFFHWWWTLPVRMGANARDIWEENKVLLVVLGFFFVFLVAFFWRDIFIKIGPGEEGVLYRLFYGGTVTDRVYHEGLRIVFPWDTMYIYDVRLQQVTDDFTVLSQDGLAVKVEVSMRFNPEHEFVGYVHKAIGPDYVEKFVKPVVQAQCRYVFGQYTPEQIYESQGFIIQTVRQDAFARMAARHILLDDLLLKSVELPPPVALAIESKLRAQQMAQEYDYRIQTETKEADRKRIEAAGIRDFQKTSMPESVLFDQYLRFKGIEATLALAQSNNSKIVIIGGGADRLPLILDGSTRADSLAPAPEAPARPATAVPARK